MITQFCPTYLFVTLRATIAAGYGNGMFPPNETQFFKGSEKPRVKSKIIAARTSKLVAAEVFT